MIVDCETSATPDSFNVRLYKSLTLRTYYQYLKLTLQGQTFSSKEKVIYEYTFFAMRLLFLWRWHVSTSHFMLVNNALVRTF